MSISANFAPPVRGLYFWRSIRYNERMKEKQITSGDAGRRLDRYLGRTFPSLPRSLMYKEIRKKNIKVNKKRCTPEQVLSAGDRVALYLPDDVLAE